MADILNNVCMLTTNHHVCKAYLCQLESMGLRPARYIHFETSARTSSNMKKPSLLGRLKRKLFKAVRRQSKQIRFTDTVRRLMPQLQQHCQKHSLVVPEFDASIEQLVPNSAEIRKVQSDSINGNEVVSVIKNCPEKFVIFCGGGILRKQMLSLDKKFIHIHPGIVPDIKGSDGILWSSLLNKNIGMSAFFMNHGIDTGDTIQTRAFELPNFQESESRFGSTKQVARFIVDFIDPVYRATVLGILFANERDPKKWQATSQDATAGKTYYAMHDELKMLTLTRWFQCSK